MARIKIAFILVCGLKKVQIKILTSCKLARKEH